MSEPNNCTACGTDLTIPYRSEQPPYANCPNCGRANPMGPGRPDDANKATLHPVGDAHLQQPLELDTDKDTPPVG